MEPGATTQMALGSYFVTEQMPAFEVTTQPAADEQVGASFEQLTIPGRQKYVAFCHLHNFSDKRCRVTVKRLPDV